MSKPTNVNPDNDKVAGREPQSNDDGSASPPASRRPAGARRQGVDPERQATGISNREPADDEARERQEHPPIDVGSPPPEDAAGRTGEQPLEDRDRQTSHKAGSRSIAQKESRARYPDRSMPPTRKVAGAFGREPQEPPARQADDPQKKQE